ncbi:MAG: hypothetical protein ACRENG_37485 [bacterium]
MTSKPVHLFSLCYKVLSYLSVDYNFALPISPPFEPARRGGISGIAFAKSSPDMGYKGVNGFASGDNNRSI